MMADGSRFSLFSQTDIMQIMREANDRWFRPDEICEILRNYQKFKISPAPPVKPPGGSLFLFDRKSLRYFRKDGHNWRKKKDGKTVREAHEKLKSGSVDVLHCYYAHGEDNESFQRRCYWMLDGQMEHIVLVHYRDINQGGRSTFSTLPLEFEPKDGVSTHVPFSTFSSPLIHSTGISYALANNATDRNRYLLSYEFEDNDSVEGTGGTVNTESMSYSGVQISSNKDNIGQESISDHTMIFAHSHSGGYFDSEITSKLHEPMYASELQFQTLMPYKSQHENCEASQITDLGAGAFDHHRITALQCPGSSGKNGGCDGILEHKTSFEQTKWASDMTMTTIDTVSEPHFAFKAHSGDQHYPLQYFPNDLIGNTKNEVELSNDQLSTREAEHSANNSSVAVNQANCEAKTSGVTKNFLTSLINESHLLYQLSDDELSKREAEHSANNSSLAAVNQANCESKASDVTKDFLASEKCENEQGTLKKLDSFGRWMNSEMGKDCEDLPVSSNSSIWKAIDPESEGKIISSFSSDMQLDIDSMDPSLPQVQLFSISDFSPDWAYSGVESKVLIIGQFLGITEPRKIKWSCMFGEVEVSAEFVANNVLKCMAPVHAPGRIPFYITCSNRSACSEIREFEYRENLSRFTSVGERNADEYSYLQLRLGKLLSMTMERKWLFCSVDMCQKCVLKQQIFSLLKDDEKDWKKIEKHCEAFQQNRIKLRDSLLERMFKDKLYEWLVCRIHEEEKGPKIFDEEGQGVIHLAAALGYKWAINPIISSGVSPSFRDAHGRTSLHWAAYFGREETVMELVRLGAAPGAVEDPTSKYPQGQTAADLASSRGYKGIAGFLAELDLTSHLSTLTVDDDERAINKFSATLAAEEAIQTFQEQNTVSSKETEHQSLRHSLHAVRNSAQAAARIQASFRLNSFRHKKLIKNKAEDSDDLTDFMVLSSNKSHRIGHFNEFLHKAATRIQQNYRGWKGRNEFLKMRERIVKLQAHFRGHQVRKQYKKVVWSVGIVEKAILRWRRKGAGLRGFRAENSSAIEHKTEAVDEYDFLRIGRRQKAAVVEKALQRVQSMARHPEGRHQYMRLSEKFKQLKLGDVQSSDDRNRSSDQENSVEDRD